MTEERITTVRDPEGQTHTHTTVVTDERRSGGGTWLIALIVLIALLVGIWAFTQMSGAEVAKDTAVTDAANSVGTAAEQVGDAAQDAANTVAN
ncbi:hypothetical protein GRI75_04155 [Altererythrobacter soli]|uniref:Uncharacterized protein n=1 Tax=Croceibacterium soli TaxID=1739690 RepID=A0A6I4UT17_9SPHN|nr:hypothetical protein [Croceibacterium soli]MXP40839.1 hypothetical protein [Croceibacterium soli]